MDDLPADQKGAQEEHEHYYSGRSRMTEAIWRPSQERVRDADMTRFMEFDAEPLSPAMTSSMTGQSPSSLLFRAEVWGFCGVIASRPYYELIDSLYNQHEEDGAGGQKRHARRAG